MEYLCKHHTNIVVHEILIKKNNNQINNSYFQKHIEHCIFPNNILLQEEK